MQTMNGTGPQRGTGLTALGVFLLSLGLMLFELSLTRVLSVLFYYHTAFLAISAAMLGSGGGALLVWFTSSAAERRISHAAQAAALTTLILPPLYGSVHLDPVQLENVGSVGFLWSLSLTMLICVLPFFFGGAALALVFRRHSRNVGRLYALDILGAAAAAPLLVPMMESYGGTGALIFQVSSRQGQLCVSMGCVLAQRSRCFSSAPCWSFRCVSDSSLCPSQSNLKKQVRACWRTSGTPSHGLRLSNTRVGTEDSRRHVGKYTRRCCLSRLMH